MSTQRKGGRYVIQLFSALYMSCIYYRIERHYFIHFIFGENLFDLAGGNIVRA
jgi:hypothetical protein